MLRIGILIRNFEELENWEMRIIENIKNDPDFELVLLIKDKEESYLSLRSKSKKYLANYLFTKQVLFEENRYLKHKETVDRIEIIDYLEQIPVLKVKPKKVGNFDIFKEEDIKVIKRYNLDIMLKHGFNSIKGEVLNASRYGVWLLVHGDHTNIAGPPGFWEILTKQSVVEVSLIQLAIENNKGYILDKAFFNRHKFSFVETNIKILESSVSLLIKNFKKIKIKRFSVSDNLVVYSSASILPKLSDIIKYSFSYFNGFFKGFTQKIQGCFGLRSNHWTLFIGKGNFLDADLSKLKPVKVPNDEFWADPFLFKFKNDHYIFFENYSYKTGLGKISCGKVDNDKLIDIVDVLDLDYHLSYPFIFEEEDEIYMMPETGANRRLEIYKCINFPDQWKIFTIAFEGEKIADAFFYDDKHKQKWLFINKTLAPKGDDTSELYIYQVDSIKMNRVEPHKQNPVIIDSKVARNGGAIFKHKNKIYRPSQSNTDGVYGKALNINYIKKLTIDEYEEEMVKRIIPDIQKGMVSIHHLHQNEGMFVFDGAFKQ